MLLSILSCIMFALHPSIETIIIILDYRPTSPSQVLSGINFQLPYFICLTKYLYLSKNLSLDIYLFCGDIKYYEGWKFKLNCA